MDPRPVPVLSQNRKISFLCQVSNPGPSNPLSSLCTDYTILITYEVPLEKHRARVEDNINVGPECVGHSEWNGLTWLWIGTIGGLL
jgi:hypothetical protein